MQRETLQTRKDPKGFEVRTEKVTCDKNDSVVLDSCYNEQGEYVGDFETAAFLYNLGIRPECIPGNKVCSIGFQEEEGKWYGWSHRAICGFGVGDIVKEGDCTATSGWIRNTYKSIRRQIFPFPLALRRKQLTTVSGWRSLFLAASVK